MVQAPEFDALSPEEKGYMDALLCQQYSSLCRVAANGLRGEYATLVEDAVQETVLRACMQIKTLRAHNNPAAWLFRTAINVCHELRRAQMKEYLVNEEVVAPPTKSDIVFPKSLPQKYRDVLCRYYQLGDSTQQIGSDLGLKEDNVRQRLKRGRDWLKKHGYNKV